MGSGGESVDGKQEGVEWVSPGGSVFRVVNEYDSGGGRHCQGVGDLMSSDFQTWIHSKIPVTESLSNFVKMVSLLRSNEDFILEILNFKQNSVGAVRLFMHY